MSLVRTLAAATVLVSSTALAQSPAALIKKGDDAYIKLDAPGALKSYQAALAIDSTNVQALWKAAAISVVLGEFNDTARTMLYAQGERYAKSAFARDSNNADVRFALAQALGRAALTVGQMQRVKYATSVYENAKKCIELDPKHAQCLHVMGEWNAQVMRIDAFSRNMAINMLGAKVLENGSWKNATDNMEAAVKLEPKRTVHHFDLGKIYADMGEKEKAKAAFTAAINAPESDYNDKSYKAKAKELLEGLK